MYYVGSILAVPPWRRPNAISPSTVSYTHLYCRAIAATEPGVENQTVDATPAINAFVAAVGELEQLGERSSDRTLVRIAVDTDGHRRATERILNLLGWKLTSSGNTCLLYTSRCV